MAANKQGSSRSRARNRRRKRHQSSSSSEEEEEIDTDPQYERRFFWTCCRDSGFPNRVNHAVAAHTDENGDYYLYSIGGYHADDDERTVVQADMAGGPFFRSSPIDVHCLDVGTLTFICDVSVTSFPDETTGGIHLHVDCRSVCDQDQNGIKQLTLFLTVEQGTMRG